MTSKNAGSRRPPPNSCTPSRPLARPKSVLWPTDQVNWGNRCEIERHDFQRFKVIDEDRIPDGHYGGERGPRGTGSGSRCVKLDEQAWIRVVADGGAATWRQRQQRNSGHRTPRRLIADSILNRVG